MSQKVTKPYELLTIQDHFMFGKVTQDPVNAETILDALLPRSVTVNSAESERRIQLLKEKKYIQLDLHAIGSDGTNYDAELQHKSSNIEKQAELPKRSRYYQSLIDGQIIDTGTNYLDMPDTYIIFICNFDPFNQNYYKYTFRQECSTKESKISLNDGTTRIFFNLTADFNDAPEETRNMLEYLAHGHVSDEATKRIADAVDLAREKEEWRKEYMLASLYYDDLRREAIAEEQKNSIKNMIQILKEVEKPQIYIIEKLMDMYNLSKETAEQYVNEYY